MWTPKRIALLFCILLLLVACFSVYAWFLGGIDGLPRLPEIYFPAEGGQRLAVQLPGRSEVDDKLLIAFGQATQEVDRVIKLEVEEKGIVFATDEFTIQKDGRVRLEPFALALFSRNRKPGKFPEINTVRCDHAYLTFDQPIKSLNDIGKRKIVQAELIGKIVLINNRKTKWRNDDVEVHIHKGPLVFNDQEKIVRSDGIVRLVDTQPEPDDTRITAKGLRIYLNKTASLTGKPKGAGKSNAKGSTVEKVVLLSNVDMHLYIDSQSGFLKGTGGSNRAARSKDKTTALEKSHIHIKTQGSFVYDVLQDKAVFTSPPKVPKKLWHPEADRVTVTRIHRDGKGELLDQLICDRLELQFAKKQTPKARLQSSERVAEKEIVSARAVSRSVDGPEDTRVSLVLNSENLAAYGVEMTYQAATKERGAETKVRGTVRSPMRAIKDAHEIQAVQLHLVAPNDEGKGQYAHAVGPGTIDLVDPASKKKGHRYHVRFDKSMTVTKDLIGDEELDLLTFVGKAAFIDDAGDQELRAEKLQLWLEPAERTKEDDRVVRRKGFRTEDAPRQQPKKLIGIGDVRIRSPKLNVRRCAHLVVRFEDGPPAVLPTPGADPAREGLAGGAGAPADVSLLPPDAATEKENGLPPLPATGASAGDLPPPPGTATTSHKLAGGNKGRPIRAAQALNQTKKKRHPIDLEAGQVFVVIRRSGKKNDLRRAMAEGNVQVHQRGSSPEEKGVNIAGQSLSIEHEPAGDILIVYGASKKKPALLQLGDLVLVGPKVMINQQDNTAEIEGPGVMKLPSNTTFDGHKPKNPNAILTIQWSHDMFFNGKDARFHGNVTADQDEARLLCKSLHVSLDRAVSLREGNEKDKKAKVERIICTDNVDIMETKRDDLGNVIRFDRLLAAELSVDNHEGRVNAAGPGKVYLWQRGSRDFATGEKIDTGNRFYLTRVDYLGRLYSTKYPDGRRTVRFFDNIEVFHLPADRPTVRIEPTRLPKGSLYMSCQKLQLNTRPAGEGKSTQVMIAEVGVRFRTDQFYGFAEKVIYDQGSDVIVFEGRIGNRVRLYRRRTEGGPYEEITGTKVRYNRRNGTFSLEGGQSIQGGG